MKIQPWQLKQRQGMPLWMKIEYSKKRIRQWYEHWDGQVYVSFSGGKDSTVLLDLVRQEYPEVPAVFVDTGLEYPEIRDFVKTVDNVVWLRPKMNFKQVIEKYGYPVISKQVSMGLDRHRMTSSDVQRKLRLYGGINPSSGKKQYASISKKWHYLVDAPFKCSEACCRIMKKAPFKRYSKQTGRCALTGSMANESSLRSIEYQKYGCNSYEAKNPMSVPLAFWLEDDVWQYLNKNKVSYSKIYDMGEKRTGCMFCMFGVHLEKGENRFQRMKKTHPKQYDYCINNLGCGKVLDFIGVSY